MIIPSISNAFKFCKNISILNMIDIESFFVHLLRSSGHIVKSADVGRKNKANIKKSVPSENQR